MAEDDKKLLKAFEEKLTIFITQYDKLRMENAALKSALAEKEAQIAQLEAQYADLKAARILSIHDNELRDTKQRLAKLVREVDKCIALLNE